ncbi:hypothetical protein L3X38_042184 [Prunus dulcis]|uniref:Uncharacterized protein n=1 Tax=Prunus dulcis TaxID=3755 RepID=A0AAD4UUD4_PRUDU|nr:hypothetical protein L3X38_042184 [Prunus dulcis]
MASSAFKKSLPNEHDLYLVLAITPNQTLAEPTRRPPPLTGDSDKRDTRKYCVFYGTHGHNTNNCFAWRTDLEERLSRPPSISMPYVDSFIYSPAFGSSSPTASPPLL